MTIKVRFVLLIFIDFYGAMEKKFNTKNSFLWLKKPGTELAPTAQSEQEWYLQFGLNGTSTFSPVQTRPISLAPFEPVVCH